MSSGVKINKTIKVVIVGDGAVGKTSLLIYYTTKSFPHEYVPTVFDNYSCIEMFEGKPISLVLWDTAGQEDYDKLRPLSYPQTDVFLVCFSVVSRDSFSNVKNKWVSEISRTNAGTPFVLIGTKRDLRDDKKILADLKAQNQEPISAEEGQQLAQELGASRYIECSALAATGINEIFQETIKTALSRTTLKKEKTAKAKKENGSKKTKGKEIGSKSPRERETKSPRETKGEEKKEKEKPKEQVKKPSWSLFRKKSQENKVLKQTA